MYFRFLFLPLAAAAFLIPTADREAATPSSGPTKVRWKKTVIDPKFRSEGVSVADVNRDGKPDILVGDLWYEAPNWKPHEIRPPGNYDPTNSYSNTFHSFAQDVNKDGWADQVIIGGPGSRAYWLRNPGRNGGEWEEYPVAGSACNESPTFADLDGDKQPEFVFPFDETAMAWWTPNPKREEGFQRHVISEEKAPGTQRYSHGLGVGDMNGDGRADVLCKDGYWIAPKDLKTGSWEFVKADLGPDSAHMHTWDFDGDGDRDAISSSAHNIGVWWHEQVKGEDGPKFVRHTIDDTFSQSHAMVMADINGDRQPDFVTGKRWWAHGPNGDVNPNDPAVLYWYEFKRKDGTVEWIRHEIDANSGVGTQFTVTDVNGDKRPDVVISNKKGVFLFQQVR